MSEIFGKTYEVFGKTHRVKVTYSKYSTKCSLCLTKYSACFPKCLVKHTKYLVFDDDSWSHMKKNKAKEHEKHSKIFGAILQKVYKVEKNYLKYLISNLFFLNQGYH